MTVFWKFNGEVRRGDFKRVVSEIIDPETKNRINIDATLSVNFRDAVIGIGDLIEIDGARWEVKSDSGERYRSFGLITRLKEAIV